MKQLDALLAKVRRCELCAPHLPLGPRPVVAAAKQARILIVGQAPGTRVHATGIPWNDPSGVRLREWLGVDDRQFYDPTQFAIVPMGLCYPGRGKSGDLPPRPECAPEWHPKITRLLPSVELTLLLSRYAIDYYLGDRAKKSVTATVQAWRDYLPEFIPMPHPSPRNNLWLKKNPWFLEEVIPYVKDRVESLLL